jgi:hypothetical protein
MKNLIITLCFALFWTSHVLSQNEDTLSSMRQLTKELINVSGQEQAYYDAVDTIFEVERKFISMIFGEPYFDTLLVNTKKNALDLIIQKQIKIYSKHLTIKELAAFVKFYQTPEGYSAIKKMSFCADEIMLANELLIKKIAEDIINDLRPKKNEKFNLEIEEDCSHFKKGRFYMIVGPNQQKISITRKDTVQTENIDGKTSKYKIKWLRNNRYSIRKWNDNEEKVLIVNIYEATENSYKFIAAFDDDYFMTGEVFIEK